jgi:hypothetical protein
MYSLNFTQNYINSIEVKFKSGKNDFGYITYKNGDNYEGYMVDQVACGNGRLTLSTGAYYEGEFNDSGLCDGVLALPEGVHFKDVFDCDCFVEGTFVFSDGTTFSGAWNLEDNKWIVVEGQMKTPDGKVIGTFQGENLVKFDNEEHTQVKIVFAVCQILGNSSFYEGGFNPETGTLDGQGLVVGSTRMYSLTNLKDGNKEGEWLFVNYWEDLPYVKYVTFEKNKKINCKTMYGNGLQFKGENDFGEGVASFPHICDWLEVHGTLSGSNNSPVLVGELQIKGGEVKGKVKITNEVGNLKTTFNGKEYECIEDLISQFPKPKESINKGTKKAQSPEIKKNMVTSIMVSQNDGGDNDLGMRSKRSSISQGRTRSKKRKKIPKKRQSNWIDMMNEEDNQNSTFISKITIKTPTSKLSRSCSERPKKETPETKKFQTGNNEIFLNLRQSSRDMHPGTQKNINTIAFPGSDDDDLEEGDLVFNTQLMNPEGLMSDNEKDLPNNPMMDLISEKPANGSPSSPPFNNTELGNTFNKSHFSFNHSIQDLQSFDGNQMEMMGSLKSRKLEIMQRTDHLSNLEKSKSTKRNYSEKHIGLNTQNLESFLENKFSSKLISKSSYPNESSGGIFRKQNPSETMKTFFVEKDNRILLFKDIVNFYSMDEDNLHINGKMISYTKECEYEGEILNDVMDGQGVLTKGDKKFSGKFSNNVLSFGKIEFGNKMVYKGQIQDLKMHGVGEISIKSNVIKASFLDDFLDEQKPVSLNIKGKCMGQIEVIFTKNKGMYLFSQVEGDQIFIFDIKKKIFRKSY